MSSWSPKDPNSQRRWWLFKICFYCTAATYTHICTAYNESTWRRGAGLVTFSWNGGKWRRCSKGKGEECRIPRYLSNSKNRNTGADTPNGKKRHEKGKRNCEYPLCCKAEYQEWCVLASCADITDTAVYELSYRTRSRFISHWQVMLPLIWPPSLEGLQLWMSPVVSRCHLIDNTERVSHVPNIFFFFLLTRLSPQ